MGNYTLLVEGRPGDGSGGVIFRNETDLMFSSKHVSVFIQTDKQLYNKKDTGELSNRF